MIDFAREKNEIGLSYDVVIDCFSRLTRLTLNLTKVHFVSEDQGRQDTCDGYFRLVVRVIFSS